MIRLRAFLMTMLLASVGTAQVPATYFGQHVHHVGNWPSAFGAVRMWGSSTSWLNLEPSNGTFTWTTLDPLLAQANAQGEDVILMLGQTPSWISSSPSDASCAVAVGACDVPSDVGSGDASWKGYVTAVVQHSLAQQQAGTGYISYYELWNEPNLPMYYNGTTAQLVTLAHDAYTIIHSLDPNAKVLTPVATHDASTFLTAYFAAGGNTATDIVSYHAYPIISGSDPELALSWVDNIKTVQTTYGVNAPLWNSESSWGGTATLSSAQEAAWVVKQYLLLWHKGVIRNYWYAWDEGGNSSCSALFGGMLWSGTTCPQGTAYFWLYSQLVGAVTVSPFCSNGGDDTWSCLLRLANGKQAQFIWNVNQTAKTISLDPRFNSCLNVDQSSCTITSHRVSVGASPILVTMN